MHSWICWYQKFAFSKREPKTYANDGSESLAKQYAYLDFCRLTLLSLYFNDSVLPMNSQGHYFFKILSDTKQQRKKFVSLAKVYTLKIELRYLRARFFYTIFVWHTWKGLVKSSFFSATAPFFVRKEHRLLVTLWLVSIFIVEMRFFCQNVGFNNFRYRRIDDIAS